MENPLQFIRASSITNLQAVSADFCRPAAVFDRLWLGLRRLLQSLAALFHPRSRMPERGERLALKILDATPSYVALLDLTNDRILYANASFTGFFGLPQSPFTTPGTVEAVHSAIHPADRPAYERFLRLLESDQENQAYKAEFRARNAHGEWRWLACQGQVFQNSRPRQALISAEDATESHQVREHLRYLSTHDSLTGLHNRAYFQEALENVRQAGQFPAAIIMMDIDNLKQVNDTYGHEAGDVILREIAGLLEDNFRAGDTIARVGGDEFTALLPQVNQANAREIVRRMRARFAAAVSTTGLSLDVVSVGLCVARDETELMKAHHQADQRMYEDKQQRKAGREAVCERLAVRVLQ